VSGRDSWRSIVQWFAVEVDPRAPEAVVDKAADLSVYDPVISKLVAEVKPSVAPDSNARVVGWLRLKGRSHAERTATIAAPASAASAPSLMLEKVPEVDMALGSVTGCIL
jgi:hypothetical protein